MGEKMNDTQAVVRWVRQHLGLELTKWQQIALGHVTHPNRDDRGYITDRQEHRLAKLLWEAYCEEMGPSGVGCYPPVEPHMKGNTAGEPIYDEAFLTEENDG